MSNPFQEQFLKSGLVSDQQVKKARTEQRKDKRRRGQTTEAEEARRAAQQAAALKAEQDRQREQQRQAEARKKAQRAEIKQLINTHRQDTKDAEIAYNFAWGDKVKQLKVHRAQQRQLASGALAIAVWDGAFFLVNREAAEKIAQRDPSYLAVFNQKEASTAATDSDDPYADFQVPDDLIW